MISSTTRTSIAPRMQRVGMTKKPTDRKPSSSVAPKGTAAAKKAASAAAANDKKTGPPGRVATARKEKNAVGTADGNKDDEGGKDGESADPPIEEEKKFEAANHMEGDLVDTLGI